MPHNGTSILHPIPDSLQELWDAWNLRISILCSLGLQIFLIIFASLRKRKSSKFVIMFIWAAYLLADWVAAFCLGLISNSKDSSGSASDKNEELLAFWAPFLLLHLGGPDTITAFALEDNELWIRHLLGLLFQFSAAAYILIQTLSGNNQLWPATLLMFLAGLIKYLERTRALYLASLSSFRDSMLTEPDPGPNYAKLMAEYSSMEEAHLHAKIEKITEPETYKDSSDSSASTDPVKINNEREMVQHAYKFFEVFKGLIVDLIFSFHDRSKSRDFFLQRTPEDAFKVIEIELSFMYEVLYTKIGVVHSRRGYFLRAVGFSATLAACFLFAVYNKKGLKKFDIFATYVLLTGGMILDFVALFMLIFSDRTIAGERYIRVGSIVYWVQTKLSLLKTSRWSESVSQFNLITFCLSKRPKAVDCVVDAIGMKDLLDEIQFRASKPLTPELKEFIFNDLKEKSKIAKDPKTAREMCSARGDWVLSRSIHHRQLGWSVEVEFDESLLLWHIATEIAYNKKVREDPANKDREFSKLFSDYMLYLLVMQSAMMSSVAGIGLIRYRDTCAEAENFFGRLEAESPEVACNKLTCVNTVIKPAEVKGDRSKSVLFDAVMLANNLEKIPEGKRWNLMCHVWLELLSYAASNCRANSHAQQLSKGGELLTFIWLLMTHLGLSQQFRIETGHARAKLIVEK